MNVSEEVRQEQVLKQFIRSIESAAYENYAGMNVEVTDETLYDMDGIILKVTIS